MIWFLENKQHTTLLVTFWCNLMDKEIKLNGWVLLSPTEVETFLKVMSKLRENVQLFFKFKCKYVISKTCIFKLNFSFSFLQLRVQLVKKWPLHLVIFICLSTKIIIPLLILLGSYFFFIQISYPLLKTSIAFRCICADTFAGRKPQIHILKPQKMFAFFHSSNKNGYLASSITATIDKESNHPGPGFFSHRNWCQECLLTFMKHLLCAKQSGKWKHHH